MTLLTTRLILRSNEKDQHVQKSCSFVQFVYYYTPIYCFIIHHHVYGAMYKTFYSSSCPWCIPNYVLCFNKIMRIILAEHALMKVAVFSFFFFQSQ